MPQCLAAATKPVKLAQGVWEVQAGLPMEAFWCVNGPDEVTKYNFTPANKGYGKAKTRKKAALVAVLQFHQLQRTAADTLALTIYSMLNRNYNPTLQGRLYKLFRW